MPACMGKACQNPQKNFFSCLIVREKARRASNSHSQEGSVKASQQVRWCLFACAYWRGRWGEFLFIVMRASARAQIVVTNYFSWHNMMMTQARPLTITFLCGNCRVGQMERQRPSGPKESDKQWQHHHRCVSEWFLAQFYNTNFRN